MKKKTIVEAVCLRCERTDRPHHALGLCSTCYKSQYRKKNKKRKAGDK